MKAIASILLAIATLAAAPAFSHESAARHGGVVQSANDISYELVSTDKGVVIHVEDHGKPLSTQGMTGKLTVLHGGSKSEAALKPAGDNRLEAAGVKAPPGAKVVAAITTPAKKAITVRFTVK